MMNIVGKYYSSCKELPLHNFIMCANNGDLKQMHKSGIYFKECARKKWEEILTEYSTLTGRNQDGILAIVRYIAFLENKINLIYYCLRSLQKNYNQKLADELNGLGLKVKIKRINISQGIRIAVSEVKRMEQSILDKNKELEGLNKNGNDFESLLIDLSKYQGYQIDTRKTTVYEFCKLTDKYKKHIQELNKKHSKAY